MRGPRSCILDDNSTPYRPNPPPLGRAEEKPSRRNGRGASKRSSAPKSSRAATGRSIMAISRVEFSKGSSGALSGKVYLTFSFNGTPASRALLDAWRPMTSSSTAMSPHDDVASSPLGFANKVSQR